MHILIYSYNYYPEPIGIAPLMTELSQGLVRRGHKVRVITGMPNYPERRIYKEYKGKLFFTEEHQGVTVQRSYLYTSGPNPSFLNRIMLELSFVIFSAGQIFKGWKPDVIFLTMPPWPIHIILTFYGWLCGCPIVLNIQDNIAETALQVGFIKKGSLLMRIAKMLEKFAYCKAQKISVIDIDFIKKLHPLGISSEKITCINNWVDTTFIHPMSKENNFFRKKYNLENKFVVLYAGNIALTQDIQIIIKTALLLRDTPAIVFVIVGESEALLRLQKDCENYKVTNVILSPFEPREKLPEMLAAADVSMIIQKKRILDINVPSKIQSILASGRAIVAAVDPSSIAHKRILQSGGGVVVPPENPARLAETLKDLYLNPNRVTLLGETGRKYAVNNYDIKKALKEYETLFIKAINDYPNKKSS